MIILEGNKPGSFKLGYSRGLPSYLAPKIFNNKKDEEYFITSLYARLLICNDYKVQNWEVCEDDSNKGADTILYFAGGSDSIQITRFTLTNYIQRRKSAERRVENIITYIKEIIKTIPFPINITVNPPWRDEMPINKPHLDRLLAQKIALMIKENIAKLSNSDEYITHYVTDSQLKKITPLIEMQSVPSGCYSIFFGRDNIFINYDFDNIGFTDADIEDEAIEMFSRKNGGQAQTLLIWSDTFETLYKPERFANVLKRVFANSSFEQIVFFSFFNRADMFLDWGLKMAVIKQESSA